MQKILNYFKCSMKGVLSHQRIEKKVFRTIYFNWITNCTQVKFRASDLSEYNCCPRLIRIFIVFFVFKTSNYTTDRPLLELEVVQSTA